MLWGGVQNNSHPPLLKEALKTWSLEASLKWSSRSLGDLVEFCQPCSEVKWWQVQHWEHFSNRQSSIQTTPSVNGLASVQLAGVPKPDWVSCGSTYGIMWRPRRGEEYNGDWRCQSRTGLNSKTHQAFDLGVKPGLLMWSVCPLTGKADICSDKFAWNMVQQQWRGKGE